MAAIFSALFCKGNIYKENGKKAIIHLIICIVLLILNVVLINTYGYIIHKSDIVVLNSLLWLITVVILFFLIL
jgi:hypothetical protein